MDKRLGDAAGGEDAGSGRGRNTYDARYGGRRMYPTTSHQVMHRERRDKNDKTSEGDAGIFVTAEDRPS